MRSTRRDCVSVRKKKEVKKEKKREAEKKIMQREKY